MIFKVIEFFNHDNLTIQRKAALSAAKLANTSHAKYADTIIAHLKKTADNQFRIHCLEALGKIQSLFYIKKIILLSIHFRPSERRKIEDMIVSMGKKTIPTLLGILKNSKYHELARILSGKILSRVSLCHLRENLEVIIQKELKRAYFYFFHTKKIEKKYPDYDLSMLIVILKTSFQSVIDFVIHLLAASGSVEDCELLVRSLRSKNAKIHSHAVETLEKTCNRKIFKWILPLVDNLPWEEVIKSYSRIDGEIPPIELEQLFEKFEKSPSVMDRAIIHDIKTNIQTIHSEDGSSLQEQIYQRYRIEALHI